MVKPTVNKGLAEPQEDAPDSWQGARYWIRLAAILATIVLAWQVFLIVRDVLSALLTVVLYVVFGITVGVLAATPVKILQKAHVPRTAAIIAVLFLILSIPILLALLISHPMADEIKSLANRIPGYFGQLSTYLTYPQGALAKGGIKITPSDISTRMQQMLIGVPALAITWIGNIFSLTINFLVVLVVAFWVLKDGTQLRAATMKWFPAAWRVEAGFVMDAFKTVVGGYVQAQLILACVVGLLSGFGCAIMGVPFPIIVGVACGFAELIPVIGPFIGGGIALLFAFTVSPLLAFAVFLLFIGIHIVESYVLSPRIQAQFVHLHPMFTLLALFAGIELAGLLGALLAVPMASFLAVMARALHGDLRESQPTLFARRPVDAKALKRRTTLLREFGWKGRQNRDSEKPNV